MSHSQADLEQNKALVMRYINEVLQQYSLAAIAELHTKDFVDHSRIADGMFDGGLSQLTEGLSAFSRAFPDLEVSVNLVLAEGNKVVVHKSFRGPQQESWRGVEPLGKRVEWELVSIYLSPLLKMRLYERDCFRFIVIGGSSEHMGNESCCCGEIHMALSIAVQNVLDKAIKAVAVRIG